MSAALVPILTAAIGFPAVVGGVFAIARWSANSHADNMSAAIKRVEADRLRRASVNASVNAALKQHRDARRPAQRGPGRELVR